MPIADLQLPTRLLAGGGPSTPDGRVLRALATPLIGQFDPAFTAIMDEVALLARQSLLTDNARCFAVSALASGGLEAVINSLVDAGDVVAVGGSERYVEMVWDLARRYGAEVSTYGEARAPKLVVLPLVDGWTCQRSRVVEAAAAAQKGGARLVVDATLGLGACELGVDDWGIDVCVAGVDFGTGAPSGMSLVTYSDEVEAMLARRRTPPRTSYLDLIQLQAYWSPERLNHHTAPTSLVYGLREALRLVQAEGLAARWERHREVGAALRDGLLSLGLTVSGEIPFTLLEVPTELDEAVAWRRLLDEYGVYVTRLGEGAWRVGLLGADATLVNARRVLDALEKVVAP